MPDLLSATRNRRPRLPQDTGSRKPIGGNVDDTPSTAGNVDQRDKLIGRRRYRLFNPFRLVFHWDRNHSRETMEFFAAVAAPAGCVRLDTPPPPQQEDLEQTSFAFISSPEDHLSCLIAQSIIHRRTLQPRQFGCVFAWLLAFRQPPGLLLPITQQRAGILATVIMIMMLDRPGVRGQAGQTLLSLCKFSSRSVFVRERRH